MNVSSMVRVRTAYAPPIVRPRVTPRVGLVDETVDSLTSAFSDSDDLASTDVLDEWSRGIEMEDPASDDPSVIEEQAKKPAATKTPPTSAGVTAAKQIQSALVFLGYDVGPTGVDGKIGPRTKAAILKFKKDQGISPADGTVTPAFRKALDAAVTKKKIPPPGASAAGAGNLLIAVLAAAAAVAAYYFLKR